MTEMNSVLDAQQHEILCAIIARLIPADDLGPGGIGARVDRYIPSVLGGRWPDSCCAIARALRASAAGKV